LSQTWQVVLAGEGGQGLLVAGIILAEAASEIEGKNATQTQSYGIATRGGFTKAEVVISDEEIIYPGVEEPNLVLALTKEAYEKYICNMPSNSIMIYDSSNISLANNEKNFSNVKIYGFDFTDVARDLGRVGVANLVALGSIVSITNIVKKESIERVIEKKFSGNTKMINKSAFNKGFELAKSV